MFTVRAPQLQSFCHPSQAQLSCQQGPPPEHQTPQPSQCSWQNVWSQTFSLHEGNILFFPKFRCFAKSCDEEATKWDWRTSLKGSRSLSARAWMFIGCHHQSSSWKLGFEVWWNKLLAKEPMCLLSSCIFGHFFSYL